MEGIEKKMWLRVMDSDALRAISVGLPQSEIAHGAEKHQMQRGSSQPEVLIGSVPDSRKSKC